MKKTTILSAIALSAMSFAAAQETDPTFGFSKGNVFVEGNLGFGTAKDNNAKKSTTNFALNPSVGYFISDKVALGVELGFESDNEKINGTETDKNSQFGAGAFLRYYFLDLGKRFKTYTNVGVGFASRTQGLAENKTSGFVADLSVGVNYFLTEKIAINAVVGNDILNYTSAKPKNGESVNQFTANLNVFDNFFNEAKFGLTFRF